MRKSHPALRLTMIAALLVSSVVLPVIITGSPTETMIEDKTPQSATETDRVILITIDGLNPHAVVEMGDTLLPNLHRMIAEGASTQNARTASEMTSTLPNHSSVYTGWTIDDHGVTFNGDDGQTIHDAADTYVSSVFSVAHDRGLSTALFAGKPKFDLIDRSWDGSNGKPDTVGSDNGPDKIDYYERSNGTEATKDFVKAMTREPFDLSVLHYAEADVAAHESGYGSDSYQRALIAIDGWIGQIIDVIETDLAGEAFVVVTADHGTDGTTHGDEDDPANYTIPFYVWGDDIPHGDLYALAAGTRTDPGNRQISPGAADQPIRNGDAANLVLDLLGLRTVPGSTFNTDQDLLVP